MGITQSSTLETIQQNSSRQATLFIIMGEWDIGLLGCFGNLSSSVITYFLPCLTFSRNASNAGTCGFIPAMISFFIPVLDCYVGAKTRQDTREKANIDGSLIGDCFAFGICPCCTMIQVQTQLEGMSMGEDMERV